MGTGKAKLNYLWREKAWGWSIWSCLFG